MCLFVHVVCVLQNKHLPVKILSVCAARFMKLLQVNRGTIMMKYEKSLVTSNIIFSSVV